MDRKQEGGGTPFNLGKVSNSDPSDFYATMHAKETIYFTANRIGGYGKINIYFSRKEKGTYTKPVNLGPIVNTSGFKSNPCILPKEDFLIFLATERSDGYGDSDLYISFKKGAQWTTSVTLRPVINTSYGEFCPYYLR